MDSFKSGFADRKDISIGEFAFNSDVYTLSSASEEVVLEPRVGELLFYLYQNKDRFISLEELHNNVWNNTIVSDTAVRRSISKLRQAFKDDAANPQYIKSLPKRGYQLIASVEPPLKEAAQNSHSDILKVSGGHIADSSYVAPKKNFVFFANLNNNVFRVSFQYRNVAITIATIGLIYLSYLFMKFYHDEPFNTKDLRSFNIDELEVIETVKSDKLMMALSPDGQRLAFSARVSEFSPYTLYMKNLKNGSLLQLTDENSQVDYVDFTNSGESVVYTQVIGNTASILLSEINDLTNTKSIFSQPGVKFGGISTVPNSNSIVAIISNEEFTEMSIYRIDLETGIKKKITSSVVQGTFDYTLKPSPDGRYLAFSRWGADDHSLRVINLESGKKLKTFNLEEEVSSIAWRDDFSILALDDGYLREFDLSSGGMQKIMNNPSSQAKYIVNIDNNKLMVLLESPLQITIGSSTLPYFGKANWLVNAEPDLKTIKFGWLPHLFVSLHNRNKGYEIVLKDSRSNTKESLVKSATPLFLHDVSDTKAEILYEENGQLWLYDVANDTRSSINSPSNTLSSASFSHDGQFIDYCEMRAEQYHCFRHSIASGDNELLIENARSVFSFDNEFLIGREDGKVELLNINKELQFTLPFVINYHTHRTLKISDEYIIFSTFLSDSNQVKIYVYDRLKEEMKTLVQSSATHSSYFDLSSDGRNILHKFRSFRSSDVYKLNL